MIDHPPDWYQEQGVEYLVFASWMYGRYYEDPARYPQQVAAYDAFFNSLSLVKQVNEGGYEMRIYRAPATP